MTSYNISFALAPNQNLFFGMFDREFTKSLIILDFNDALKNPFRYVDFFLSHTLLLKKISENRHVDL